MNQTPSSDFRCGFVAIVGRPNVGKSTLMNHLIGQKISITSKKAQTTRHKITGVYTDERSQFIFVDTPGFQTRHRNALNDRLNQNVTEALGGVDVVAFVVEAMRFSEADRAVVRLLPKHLPVILVVNKIDRAKSKAELEEFIETVRREFDFAGAEAVSAKHGLRIGELLAILRPHLHEGVPLYPEDAVTDRSARFLAAEIVREKLFRHLGEELPYAANVAVEQFEEEDGLYRIYIAVLVDKDGQKAIIIGKRGSRLKEIGSRSRPLIEELLDKRVYLDLHVRTAKDWQSDPKMLGRLGF